MLKTIHYSDKTFQLISGIHVSASHNEPRASFRNISCGLLANTGSTSSDYHRFSVHFVFALTNAQSIDNVDTKTNQKQNCTAEHSCRKTIKQRRTLDTYHII